MSLNLGPQAYDAIQRLKNNADWRVFVEALEDTMSTVVLRAVAAPIAERVDATGYSRAIGDLVSHIGQIERPEPGGRAPRTVVKPRELTRG